MATKCPGSVRNLTWHNEEGIGGRGGGREGGRGEGGRKGGREGEGRGSVYIQTLFDQLKVESTSIIYLCLSVWATRADWQYGVSPIIYHDQW
jgi:hypothetical protein